MLKPSDVRVGNIIWNTFINEAFTVTNINEEGVNKSLLFHRCRG